MEKSKTQLQTLMESKTVGEIFRNITYEMLEKIAFIPVILFAVSPIIQIIFNFFTSRYYSDTINDINITAGLIGFLTIIIYIKKMSINKYGFEDFRRDNKPMIFFIVFVLLMFVSTIVNGFDDYAIHGKDYRNESLFTYTLYFMVYFFCASLIKSKKLKAVLLYSIIFGSLFMGILVIIHIYVQPFAMFIHTADRDMLTSVFENSNHYAYYLTVAILLSSSLFIMEKNKILKSVCLINFIINNIILVVNDTFGCYIACFMGLLFSITVLFICNRKVNPLSVLMLLIFISISAVMTIWYETILTNIYALVSDVKKISTNPDNAGNAGTSRWRLWTTTMECIKKKPVFGYGVEGNGERLANMAKYDRPHNEFLQYTAFFGIPAGIAYICGVMSVFLDGLKNKLKLDLYTITAIVASFGYLVSSFFGNTMYYTAPFLFILLGLGFTGNKENIKEKESNINE